MVDQYMNCEDIAMNFLVSHITRKPPLKVWCVGGGGREGVGEGGEGGREGGGREGRSVCLLHMAKSVCE